MTQLLAKFIKNSVGGGVILISNTLLVSLTVLGTIEPSNASSIKAIDFPTSNLINNASDDTIGFRFTVGSTNINVTALGFFDDNQNGLIDSHAVGIYDVTTQNLIVSTTIPSGTAGTLDGLFRFVNVSPTLLLAGQTYVINGYRLTASDAITYDVSNLSVSSLINYITEVGKPNTGGLVFNNTPFAGGAVRNGWFGPNFAAQPQSVPEPSSVLSLLGLGFLGLGASLRKKQQ